MRFGFKRRFLLRTGDIEGDAERGSAGAVAGEEVLLAWPLLCRPGREGQAAGGVLA